MSQPTAPADALFVPRGSTLVPTPAAIGPWSEDSLHGAAVAALLAGRLTVPGRTLARLTVELLAPVPCSPLTLDLSRATGGARAQRQEAVLSCDGRAVASARSVTIRRTVLDLPPRALVHGSPFDPAAAPVLEQPNPATADLVGWNGFDSMAVVTQPKRVPDDRAGVYLWVRLTVPVVHGTEVTGTELAAVAADYAATAVPRLLPYESWSFRNAELTLHLAHEPVGPWLGIRCDAFVQPVGVGAALATLYDADGRLGQSASALVVESRPTT